MRHNCWSYIIIDQQKATTMMCGREYAESLQRLAKLASVAGLDVSKTH